jgi:hypothetical protein
MKTDFRLPTHILNKNVGYMQSQGLTGADIAQSAKEYAANASPMPAYSMKPLKQALARGPAGNAVEGFKQLGSKEGLKTLGGKLGYAGVAGLAAPIAFSAMNPSSFNPPAKRPEQYAHKRLPTTHLSTTLKRVCMTQRLMAPVLTTQTLPNTPLKAVRLDTSRAALLTTTR